MHRIGDQFINTHTGGVATIIEIEIDSNGEFLDEILYTLKGSRTGMTLKLDEHKLDYYLLAGLLKEFNAVDRLQPKRYSLKRLVM